jgi:hypothetical protein
MNTKYKVFQAVWVIKDNKVVELFVWKIVIQGDANKQHEVTYSLIDGIVRYKLADLDSDNGWVYSEANIFSSKLELISSL